MLEIVAMVAGRERPGLLVKAARRGVQGYRRANHLRRLLGQVPRPAEALIRLLEMEAAQEAQRREGQAQYAAGRHVEVLIAILGEVAHLRASRPALGLVAA